LIRSSEAPSPLISSLKRTATTISLQIVLNFSVFRTSILEGLIRERLMVTLSAFYGVLAAILSMVGLYGIISYMVVRRRNEIGFRIALGASKANILSIILRESLVLLGTGLVIGIMLAVAAGIDLYGKGSRIRTVTVPIWIKQAIETWITAASIDKGRLLRPLSKSGKIVSDELGDWAIWSIVEQSSKQIGIEHCGAHDLRRTCAKLCRKNRGDLEQIKFLLGTRRYRPRSATWDRSRRSQSR
jgi:hypothetical protein